MLEILDQEKMVELSSACIGMHLPRTHLCLLGQSVSLVQAAAVRGDENTITKIANTTPILPMILDQFSLSMDLE